MEALERANVVRLARAELKRHIKAGDVLVAEVLLGEVPDWLEAMPVEELCNSIRRFQRKQFEQLAFAVPFGLFATVGKLTSRQLSALGNTLAEWETAAVERRARPRNRGGKTPSRAASA
jgi:hypothetical protein